VAFGLEHHWGIFKRGVLVTQHLENTIDLQTLSRTSPETLKNIAWLKQILQQVATHTRQLHNHHFIHNDLKWRNILVTLNDTPSVYFFDCPLGTHWWGPFFKHRQIKDLACLDKVAKNCLTQSQRLLFFKQYRQIESLTSTDKKMMRKILTFFKK